MREDGILGKMLIGKQGQQALAPFLQRSVIEAAVEITSSSEVVPKLDLIKKKMQQASQGNYLVVAIKVG